MLAYIIRHETVPWSFQYSSVTSVKIHCCLTLFIFLGNLCFQDIVIGTPGRMKDLIEMGICHLNEVSFVVSQFCLWLCYSCLNVLCILYMFFVVTNMCCFGFWTPRGLPSCNFNHYSFVLVYYIYPRFNMLKLCGSLDWLFKSNIISFRLVKNNNSIVCLQLLMLNWWNEWSKWHLGPRCHGK